MSDRPCCSCNDLKDHAPDFALNGVTDNVCDSLQKDTGLNEHAEILNDDFTDLTLANDCLIGNLNDEIEQYEDEIKLEDKSNFLYTFIKKSIPNIFNVLKSIICSLGGAWKKIHDLENRINKLEKQ